MSLEREIEDLFTIDHSPEFLAQVRGRVAEEQPARTWTAGWWLAPAAGLFGAAILALTLWALDRRVPAGPMVVASAPDVALPLAAPPVPPMPVPHPRVARVDRARFPEVMIPEEEMLALRLLLGSVRQGVQVELPAADPLSAEQSLLVDEVRVVSLTIRPLEQLMLEGDRP